MDSKPFLILAGAFLGLVVGACLGWLSYTIVPEAPLWEAVMIVALSPSIGALIVAIFLVDREAS